MALIQPAAPTFIPNNRHERIWQNIPNDLLNNKGFAASPAQCRKNDLVLIRIVDSILVIVLRIIDLILVIIVHRIINHIPTIIQGIIDSISKDTEGGHILHEEGEVFH
ncbi:17189_t:CDS:2 [Funneliformis geosporum]|nr:17189_t:CDS:2 [Funneliformis geosporum]